MADAESNLVPSEAADQVEVALEKQAAADDGILYLNEYQYENDLVTDFARLVASPRRIAARCMSPRQLPRSSASACWWPAATGSSLASC